MHCWILEKFSWQFFLQRICGKKKVVGVVKYLGWSSKVFSNSTAWIECKRCWIVWLDMCSKFDTSFLCLFKYWFCLRIVKFLGEVLDFSFHKQMLVEEHVLVSYTIWGHQVLCVMIVLCLPLACCKAIKTVSFLSWSFCLLVRWHENSAMWAVSSKCFFLFKFFCHAVWHIGAQFPNKF